MKEDRKTVKGKRNFPSKEEIAKDLKTSTHDDSEENQFPELPEEERQCVNAKMFLMKQSDDPQSTNLYDHLSRLLTNVLEQEDPEEAINNLEDLSYQIKRDKLPCPTPTVRPKIDASASDVLAKTQHRMMQEAVDDKNFRFNDEDDEDKYRVLPDVMRQAYFYEQAGIGLSREEFIRISVAMRNIVDDWPIESIRFWGKFLGLYRNYYIVETDFHEGEYESDTSDAEEDEVNSSLEEQTTDSIFDDLSTTEMLKPINKEPPRIPCEGLGTGLNKKVYFVCNEPGMPWVRLPHITPAQIVTARKVKTFFTGYLDSKLVTYPPFPGLEKNYLRAQIARITASTTISPIGYYRFDDEEEGEEESGESGGGRDTCIVDPEFDGIPTRDLAESQSWCHHMLPILPQGRNVWFNPVEGSAEGEGEVEDEEDRNEPDEPQPEVGPPLLTPLTEDQDVGESPAWITSLSSKFIPEYSLAVLKSNVWPGACAFAAERGKFFENIYLGWGHKNQGGEFQPEVPSATVTEFPSGPEITEADDPTPEEEAAVQNAMQEKEFGIDDDDDDDDGEHDDD